MKNLRDPELGSGTRQLFLVAVAAALVCGASEAAVGGAQLLFTDRLIFVSEDFAWMTPLAYLVWFLLVATAVAVVSLLTGRRVPLSSSVGAFGALTILCWLLPWQQVQRLAALVLAAGVGVQLGRLASRAPERWVRGAKRVAVALAAACALAGVTIRGARAVLERRALAALPPARAGAPNVLFVVFDTVRRANLGLYGYARPISPRLDSLAAGGVVFDNAIATAPWTLPSHGSLFTGLPAERAGGDWRRRTFSAPPVLAEALRARGYLTAGFVGNLGYTSFSSGLSRGFVHYEDYPLNWYLVMLHSSIGRTSWFSVIKDAEGPEAKLRAALFHWDLSPQRNPGSFFRSASQVTDGFVDWLAREGDRPFFAFVNLFDAHQPYRAPDEYLATFHGRQAAREDRYDAAIAFMDHELGRMSDALARRGRLDHTLVIVLADHGEQFGEHGFRGHANTLYLPLLQVPLVMRYPGVLPAGVRVAPLVTLRDVAATVADVTGLPASLPGVSLARYWKGGDPAASDVVSWLSRGINVDSLQPNRNGPLASRMDERFHYIVGPNSEELYDWRADPREIRNLAAVAALLPDRTRLRQGLYR